MTAPLRPEIALVIRFDPNTGQVNIQGPLADRLFCYGLLEMAREILAKRATEPKPGTGKIVVPQLHLRGPLK